MSGIVVRGITCVWPAGRLLGEGPWWSGREQALYWVDIKRPAILRYRPGGAETSEWPMPEQIGCCAPRRDGGLVGATRSGIYGITLKEPGTLPDLVQLVIPAGHMPGDRFNDGKCHPDGAFWAGTMDDGEHAQRGWFYRLDPSHKLERVAGPYNVCNGPAFSPDGRFAYLTDSGQRTIFRKDLAAANTPPEPFVRFSAADGFPDGMTTDTNGRLWIAFWDGGKVLCIGQTGERIASLELPVSRPTACAFGGDKLQTLFVTSASIGLSRERLQEENLAGGLFAIDLDVAEGWETPAFAG